MIFSKRNARTAFRKALKYGAFGLLGLGVLSHTVNSPGYNYAVAAVTETYEKIRKPLRRAWLTYTEDLDWPDRPYNYDWIPNISDESFTYNNN